MNVSDHHNWRWLFIAKPNRFFFFNFNFLYFFSLMHKSVDWVRWLCSLTMMDGFPWWLLIGGFAVLLLKCGYNRRSLRWVGCNFWWGAWWLLAALGGNNGLGRFEFAFYFFIFLYFFIIMVEKSRFVLELCTFNFVLDYTFTFIYLFIF